jgi:hypothetical protein
MKYKRDKKFRRKTTNVRVCRMMNEKKEQRFGEEICIVLSIFKKMLSKTTTIESNSN